MKSRVKTWQVRGIWSQQLEHQQVPKWGTEPGVRKGKRSLLACHTCRKCSMETSQFGKSTSVGHLIGEESGKLVSTIRAHASPSPKRGRNQVSGVVSVPCWHATPKNSKIRTLGLSKSGGLNPLCPPPPLLKVGGGHMPPLPPPPFSYALEDIGNNSPCCFYESPNYEYTSLQSVHFHFRFLTVILVTLITNCYMQNRESTKGYSR